MRKVILGVVAVSAVACSGNVVVQKNDDIPLWAQRKSGKCLNIPEFEVTSANLCATGVSENISSYSLGIETASTLARAEIGAVMQTKVKSFNRLVNDSLSKQGKTDEIQKVERGAQSMVDTILAGVTVPITYNDKSTGRYFAMAMVDAETFQKAVGELKNNQGLSEAVKEEITKRADDVVKNWTEAEERANN